MQWLVDLILKLFSAWLNKTPAPIVEAQNLGKATQKVADVQKQANTQTAIANAEAQAPATAAAAVASMDKGEF